jgi:hypothetical protein
MNQSDDRYSSLEQRVIALESKLEILNHLPEELSTLSERLTALESKLESLNPSSSNLAALTQRLEQLSNLEAMHDRFNDNFSMIADIDTFARLRDLLVEGDFKAADEETATTLFGIINKTADTITPDDIEAFPAAPIRIVDRLWRKYSNDRFGPSVQLKVYRELGGDLNSLIAQDEELFLAFCDRVGWRQNGKFIFGEAFEITPSSPEGFLPASWWKTPYGLKIANFILARLIKIGL